MWQRGRCGVGLEVVKAMVTAMQEAAERNGWLGVYKSWVIGISGGNLFGRSFSQQPVRPIVGNARPFHAR